jgi:high-affinity iron transporter
MARNLFSVPIFFIVFRETFEAAIIVSVLLSIIEQIVRKDPARLSTTIASTQDAQGDDNKTSTSPDFVGEPADPRPILKKSRIQVRSNDIFSLSRNKCPSQIFLGAGLGLLLALAIGAAFIAVWFTKANNLWSKSEELWEGLSCQFPCPAAI